MPDLDGKVVLVTGGDSGMGLASCRAFADAGAEVIIADRDTDAAERAAEEARLAGGKATAYRVDCAGARPRRRSSARPRRPGCGHQGAVRFTEPARPAFSC